MWVKELRYPRIEEKDMDYDTGPFADTFSAAQHKFGPYPPIVEYRKKNSTKR